jgi:hypothetical protein
MARFRRGTPLSGLRQAFDEARYGNGRTLNLRDGLPTPAEAVARAEAWLRQQQVDLSSRSGDAEVLIITGRGNNSPGGISVVRSAIEGLIHRLRSRGVVATHREHTPGSGAFALELADACARDRPAPHRSAIARRAGSRDARVTPAARGAFARAVRCSRRSRPIHRRRNGEALQRARRHHRGGSPTRGPSAGSDPESTRGV